MPYEFDFQSYVQKREANPNQKPLQLQNYAFIEDIEHQRELSENGLIQQAVSLGLQAWQLAKGRKYRTHAVEIDASYDRLSSAWTETCYLFKHTGLSIKVIPFQKELFTPYSGKTGVYFGISPMACTLPAPTLKFLFGTGLGALDNGHAPYLTLQRFFDDLTHGLWGKATSIPEALIRWREAAVITQDRAGMLACRDISAAIMAIMKSYLDWDNSEIMREIRRYHDGLDVDWGELDVEKRVHAIEAFMQSDIYLKVGGQPISKIDAQVHDIFRMVL
ncbi:MAG: hypothetical protein J6A01_03015 [Proteobacteria bacterium]|nr:hypothetical protein [Pseudomonadota bacterium]